MSEAGPLDLDYPCIYLFEVGADEKEGRKDIWREDTLEGGLGRAPLANAMSLPATRPTDTSPVRVGKSAFRKNLFSIHMAKIDNGQRPKKAICQKADQRNQRQKMRFDHNPPKSATYALSML